MGYTTTEFIASVKRRAAIPTSQSTYTEAGILAIGDEELRSDLLPLIMKSQEGYYDFDVDTSVNATGVYEIPTRAVGGKLVNAALIDGSQRVDLAYLTEDSLGRLDETYGSPGFYIKRNQVYLVPADVGLPTFRQTIILRPGQLVVTSAAAQITAIDTGTGTLTFTSGTIPATFTTALTYDFIQQNPHFDHIEIDKTSPSITSTTMVFSSLSARLAVGDWVAIAGQSPIVQVPVEIQPLLIQETVNTILRGQGDLEKLAAGEKKSERMEKSTTNLYTPRVEDEGKKLVNKTGILRRN